MLAELALSPAPEANAATLRPYVQRAPEPRSAGRDPAPPASSSPPADKPATRVTHDDQDDAGQEEPAPTTPVIAARINVNTAPVAELDLLPGVGPVIARRIIDERAANGPYRDLQDLQRVRGIGPKTAAKMADHVRFD